MSYLTDRLWGVYKEFRDSGLNVSLSVSVCNGAETFVFQSVPSHGAVGLQSRGRRRRRRGRGGRARRAQQAQPSAAGPSYADVARSPPSPPQDRRFKRARRSGGVATAVSGDTGTAPPAAPAAAADAGVPADADDTAVATRPKGHRPPPLTMELRKRAASASSPSPSAAVNPTCPSVPLSPLVQLDGEVVPDLGSPPTPTAPECSCDWFWCCCDPQPPSSSLGEFVTPPSAKSDRSHALPYSQPSTPPS